VVDFPDPPLRQEMAKTVVVREDSGI
jgi:hypothetical protein